MVFSDDVTEFRRTTEAKITRRAVWAMSTLLVLMVMVSVFTEVLIDQQQVVVDEYASSINIAGRQRMLSQRIVYLSEILVATESRALRLTTASDLNDAAKQMRAECDFLISSVSLSPELIQLYYDVPVRLEARTDAYIAAAMALAVTESVRPDNPDYQAITAESQGLLTDLESAVMGYENALTTALVKMREMNRARTSFVIIGLVVMGLLMLWPGAVAVKRYVYLLYGRVSALRHQITLMEERQAFSESMLASLPSALSVYEITTHQTVFMNERYRQLLGYEVADGVVPELYNLGRVVHPDDLERARSCMTDAAETGLAKLGEYRFRRKDGSYVTVESRAAALKRGGLVLNPPQLVALLREVAATRPVATGVLGAVDPEALIESLSALFGDAIFVYDTTKAGAIYFSRRMADMLGYSVDELNVMLSALATFPLHPDDQADNATGQANVQKLAAGKMLERTIRLKHKDGDWRTFYVRTIAQTFDAESKPLLLIGVCFDLRNKPVLSGSD